MNETTGPIETIRESPLKTVLFLAVSLGFVALFLSVKSDWGADKHNVMPWIGIGFFGLCTVTFSILLVRPYGLVLDDHGFKLRGGLIRSPRTIAWSDIDRFFVYSAARGTRLVGYNYRPGRAPTSPLLELSRGLGAEGALPGGWECSPEALADKLNKRLAAEKQKSGALADDASFPAQETLPSQPTSFDYRVGAAYACFGFGGSFVFAALAMVRLLFMPGRGDAALLDPYLDNPAAIIDLVMFLFGIGLVIAGQRLLRAARAKRP